MNELIVEGASSDEGGTHQGQGDRKRSYQRRNPTLIQEPTPKQKFNKVIYTTHNMIGVMYSMHQHMFRNWRDFEDSKRHKSPL